MCGGADTGHHLVAQAIQRGLSGDLGKARFDPGHKGEGGGPVVERDEVANLSKIALCWCRYPKTHDSSRYSE